MKKVIIALMIIVGLLLTFFYFLPAFRGDILVSPSFSIGPLSIRWYGVILALSIWLGYLIASKNSWRFGIGKAEVDNIAFWLVVVGIIGARLYYVIFAFDQFLTHPSEIYKIWHGGLSIYGAILGDLIFLFFYSRTKAYSLSQVLDLVALSLPLSQALGRFGNFFNQEAYGVPTDLPWKMYVSSTDYFVHPTFLYEAIWNIIVFLILIRLTGKVKSGVLAVCYLGLYSVGRFFIEMLRTDSVFIYSFRVDQVMALILIVVSGLVIWKLLFFSSNE